MYTRYQQHKNSKMNKAKRYYLAMVFLLIFHSTAFANSNLAQKIVSKAKAEIGKGETTANNSGKDVEKYLRTKENLSWCAGFVSYVLTNSGIKIEYTLRAKDFLSYGVKVPHALPGDIVVFTRKGGGHVGVVEIVTDAYYIAIEGNVGDFPAKVKRIKHFYNEKNFLCFRRLN